MKYIYSILPFVFGISLMGCGSDNGVAEATAETNGSSDINSAEEFVVPDVEYGSDLPDSAPVLSVSTAANNAPFEFKDEYGNPMGMDIDIIKAIGAVQGFKVQINNDSESNLLTNLKDGNRDIIIAGLSHDPSLESKYGISDPYHFSSVVMTYIDPELNINSPQDLNNLTLGIVKGTKISDNMIPANQARKMVAFDTAFLAIKALIAGEVDAFAANEEVIRFTAREIPKFSPEFYRFDDSIENTERKSIYVAKQDAELLKSINEGLKEIVRNGNYGEITVKWLDVEKSREYNERFEALQAYDANAVSETN